MESELNYRQAYLALFNAVSDCISLLRESQREAEERCISGEEA